MNTESWLELHGFNEPKEAIKIENCGQVDIGPCSAVTKFLIYKLVERDKAGKAKYGTSLDRTDLTKNQWLDHMTEELLDAAGYAQCSKDKE